MLLMAPERVSSLPPSPYLGRGSPTGSALL